MNRAVLTAMVCGIGLGMIAQAVLAKGDKPIDEDLLAATARYALDHCERQNATRCYVTAVPVPRFDK